VTREAYGRPPRLVRGGRAVGLVVAVALGLTAVAAPGAAAQIAGVPAVEVWGGAAIGSFAPTSAGLERAPGPAWGAAVSWGPGPALGGYVAFSSIGFGCEGGFCQGFDVSLASRGLSLGVRAEAPRAGSPWLRAGLLLHRLEQEWVDGSGARQTETTDVSAGIEGAAGLSWQVADRVSLNPGFHLGFLPTKAPDGVTENLFFTALELALRFRL
jgi:hypothetical protein